MTEINTKRKVFRLEKSDLYHSGHTDYHRNDWKSKVIFKPYVFLIQILIKSNNEMYIRSKEYKSLTELV